MYAVIRDGGKQYKIEQGDTITIDRKDTLNISDKVEFKDILMLSGEEGPIFSSQLKETVSVIGEVQKHSLGEKLLTTKFRRRKNSRTKKGHRQKYTEVRIKEIIT